MGGTYEWTSSATSAFTTWCKRTVTTGSTYYDDYCGHDSTGSAWVGWCQSTNASTIIRVKVNWDGSQAALEAWEAWQAICWDDSPRAYVGKVKPREQTAEEREAEKQRLLEENRRLVAAREEAERKLAEETARRKKAEETAELLLISYLDTLQKAQYEREKAFTVIGESGKRYRVERRRSGNVVELEERDGKHLGVARYCAHHVADVPVGDDMLAAMLMLRHDEKEYLKIANRTKVTPYAVPVPVGTA